MRQLYETFFGIFNHFGDEASRRPLSEVAMFEPEKLSLDDPLLDHARAFLDRGIGEGYNISFLEYMALPASLKNSLHKAMAEYNEVKAQALNNLDIAKDLKK